MMFVSLFLWLSLFSFVAVSKTITSTIFPELPTVAISSCLKPCKCYYDTLTSGFFMWTSFDLPQSSVSILSCADANFTDLPGNIPRVQAVILSNNRISLLHTNSVNLANITSNLSSVSMLNLQNNLIYDIDVNYFKTFHNLQWLILSQNVLSNQSWIQGLITTGIVYLDVSKNHLTSVFKEDFGVIKSLKRLDLSHNYITMVEPLAFEAFPNLEFLDLSYNQISSESLQEDSLLGIPMLVSLSLSNNRPLTRIPDFKFAGLNATSLRVLDLHGLEMVTTINYGAFDRMTSLEKLNLSQCSITSLKQGWLNGGPHSVLKTLDLSYNKLERLRSGVFVGISTENFKGIFLQSSSEIDPSSLPYLVSPSVQTSKISYKDISIFSLTNNIDDEFDPNTFLPLSNLQWLSVSNNLGLSILEDDVFSYLPMLKFLFLQKCNISSLLIASTSHRYEMNAILDTLPHLEALWVYDNPLYCDCHVGAIRNALLPIFNETLICHIANKANMTTTTTNGFHLDATSYFYEGHCLTENTVQRSICFFPQNMQKFYVTSVTKSLLTCVDKPTHWIIVMLIGPFAFAASIFIVMLCGCCSIIINRERRQRSSTRRILEEHKALRQRDKHNQGALRHRKAKPRYRRNAASTNPIIYQGFTNKTNMVLGRMGSREATDLPFFNRIQSFNRSRPSTPSPKQLYKNRSNQLPRFRKTGDLPHKSSTSELLELQRIKNKNKNNSTSTSECGQNICTDSENEEISTGLLKRWRSSMASSSSEKTRTMPFIDGVDSLDNSIRDSVSSGASENSELLLTKCKISSLRYDSNLDPQNIIKAEESTTLLLSQHSLSKI